MNLLLDSHTLLWLMDSNPQLSTTATGLIADPLNHLYLSMASIWEIAIKTGLGKLALTVPYSTFLDTAIDGDENTGRLFPVLQVGGEMCGHRHAIEREEDPILTFDPIQNRGIECAQRQIDRIADPHGINDQATDCIVALDRSPKRTTKVFIDQESDRHDEPSRGSRFGLLKLL